MKTFILTLSVIVVLACNSKRSDKVNTQSDILAQKKRLTATKVQIIDSVIDLGVIEQGIPKTVFFRFKNIGNSDLILWDLGAGCGCTKPKLEKDIYKPGEEGKIEATYNANSVGVFNKDIYANANIETGQVTGGRIEFIIKGEVVKK